jgi:hypothetical protein
MPRQQTNIDWSLTTMTILILSALLVLVVVLG